MRILTSNHYIARFTVPPQAEHPVARVQFVNLGRLWSPALAIAAWPPLHTFDLAHFINQIPLRLRKPWLVTFESALPRMFPPKEPLRQYLRDQLRQPQCLGIIAMSAWAMANFERLNAGWPGLPEVLGKSLILAPALAPQATTPVSLKPGQTIQVVFVGNNFSRKGGIVALRLATKALAHSLPLHMHLVSTKMVCSGSHTDHPDQARYVEDLKALALPNVTFHGARNNQQVHQLMKQCHLSFLATLHDTYGFSVLEGFAHGLPAITSDVCALPEFVFDATSPLANGYLLRLPKDRRGCWLHEADAGSPDYWEMLDQAFTSMTQQAFMFLDAIARAPGRLEELSYHAIAAIEQRHHQGRLARSLSAIYCKTNLCGVSQHRHLAGNQTAAE
jgi:glycosyltransferase involved in cell wall biosynthesis